jgi:hypothetical protein
MKPIKIVIAVLLSFIAFSPCFSRSYDVPLSVDWIKQNAALAPGTSRVVYNALQVNALPGDTLFLIGGTRNSMRIDDLRGDSLNPIVICNKNSKVTITQPVGGYVGMAFSYCRYVKVSGKNNAALAYGIHITQIPAGSAFSINNYSSNFEVEGLEISRIYSSGFVAKTDPTCSNYTSYGAFVMFDIQLHHNYIHHVGNEGFYLGNTGYADGAGIRMSCSGASFFLLPHKIVGIKVYENIVDSTGWDGIQVASAEQVEIYNNYINNDSYADVSNQQSGIFIGQPARAKVYGNIILNSKGSGIQCFGVGTSIYNNVIVNPGSSKTARGYYNSSGSLVNSSFTYGIYINDKVCRDATVPKLPYLVAHNTVIIQSIYRVGAPYNTWAPQGINANSLAYISGSLFANNLILIDSNLMQTVSMPINGIYSSNSVPGYSTTLAPAFVSCNSRSTLDVNFYSNEIYAVGFSDVPRSNFSLQAVSLAVDAASGTVVSANSVLQKDILGTKRPQGAMPDFGAYELLTNSSSTSSSGMVLVPNPLSMSAMSDFDCVINDTNTLSVPMVTAVGAYSHHTLSIVSDQIVSGKRLLRVSGTNLPNQPGVYSVQVRDGAVLKFYANLFLLP